MTLRFLECLFFRRGRSNDELVLDFWFQSENTFLLALDGDVDFKPEALQLLVDRLRKNEKVGVVCGRIHPIGSGDVKFTYYTHLLYIKIQN